MEPITTATRRAIAPSYLSLAAALAATLAAALAMTLAMMFAAAAPAEAQAADQYGPGDGTVQETDLVAELAVECPENESRVVGYQLVTTGVESRTAVPLTDEDGNGVFTGTQTFPRFPPGPQPSPGSGAEPITVDDVRIVAPEGGTVEQFGPVKLDRDEIVLAASVSLCDGGGGEGGGTDQYDPGDGTAGGSPLGDGPARLPETGGASLLTTLGAGALLVVGGLLIRKVRR